MTGPEFNVIHHVTKVSDGIVARQRTVQSSARLGLAFELTFDTFQERPERKYSIVSVT